MICLHNTLTKKKEPFEPLYAGKVGMYTCGPTVYNHIHIGNIRAYLTADILRRILEHMGYEVRAIKNITDVGHLTADDIAQGDSGEDKIEKKALAEKKTPEEIARFYEESFRHDEMRMNILPAHAFPRATAHVPDMIKLIETLIERDHAYEKNGHVFLDVTSFPHYGILSGNTLEKLKVGARLEEHPDKRHPWDFALWLPATKGHLMHWSSPWSDGYPGWHIECSAMSLGYLGDSFDIHTGGEDNIFPHHEAEVVQSEGATKKPFARFWIHTRHLLVDGEKMAKSKGNFYTLSDIIEKGFDPMDLRLAMLASHYRSQMNFTWNALEQARTNRNTLETLRTRLAESSANSGESLDTEAFARSFASAIEDDLNTPEAIALLLTLANETNKKLDEQSLSNPEDVLKTINESLDLLGIVPEKKQTVPAHILKLAKARQKAREEKKFREADSLREEIEKAGWSIKDTPHGFQLKS